MEWGRGMPTAGSGIMGFILQAIVLFILLGPIVVGFSFVRFDANRNGQPGWLWALLTIPFSWFAILGYLIMRGITMATSTRAR